MGSDFTQPIHNSVNDNKCLFNLTKCQYQKLSAPFRAYLIYFLQLSTNSIVEIYFWWCLVENDQHITGTILLLLCTHGMNVASMLSEWLRDFFNRTPYFRHHFDSMTTNHLFIYQRLQI